MTRKNPGAGIGAFSTKIHVSEQSANINLHLSCACDIDRSRGFNDYRTICVIGNLRINLVVVEYVNKGKINVKRIKEITC
ncbi:Hypothetical predicted protein [Paramuricea clavata]|nr:Hypothetical predicted protein [Paramuricea clavata]